MTEQKIVFQWETLELLGEAFQHASANKNIATLAQILEVVDLLLSQLRQEDTGRHEPEPSLPVINAPAPAEQPPQSPKAKIQSSSAPPVSPPVPLATTSLVPASIRSEGKRGTKPALELSSDHLLMCQIVLGEKGEPPGTFSKVVSQFFPKADIVRMRSARMQALTILGRIWSGTPQPSTQATAEMLAKLRTRFATFNEFRNAFWTASYNKGEIPTPSPKPSAENSTHPQAISSEFSEDQERLLGIVLGDLGEAPATLVQTSQLYFPKTGMADMQTLRYDAVRKVAKLWKQSQDPLMKRIRARFGTFEEFEKACWVETDLNPTPPATSLQVSKPGDPPLRSASGNRFTTEEAKLIRNAMKRKEDPTRPKDLAQAQDVFPSLTEDQFAVLHESTVRKVVQFWQDRLMPAPGETAMLMRAMRRRFGTLQACREGFWVPLSKARELFAPHQLQDQLLLQSCKRCNGAISIPFRDNVREDVYCVNCSQRTQEIPLDVQEVVDRNMGEATLDIERYAHSEIGTGKPNPSGWERELRKRAHKAQQEAHTEQTQKEAKTAS